MADIQQADTQQVANAEKFRKVLETSDELTKNALLSGNQTNAEILKILQDVGYPEAEAAEILGYRQDYFVVESLVTNRPVPPTKPKEDKLSQTTTQASRSVGSGMIGAPVAIYAYFFDNPDRYSAKQLEKKAEKEAKSKAESAVKKAEKEAKKAKRKLTNEERTALYNKAHDKAKMEFHDRYVMYHDTRARQLAKDPTTNNPFLKRALFYKDARAAMAKATTEARKDKSLKFISIKSLPQAVRTQIPKTSTIRTVVSGSSQTVVVPISPAGRPGIRGARNRFFGGPRAGRGVPNPLGKLLPKNPLSLLRRFLLPISITGTLICVVLFTAIITFFFFDIGGVAGGTGSDQSGQGITPISIDDVKQYIIISYKTDSTGYSGSGDPVVAGVQLTDAQKNVIYSAFAKPLGNQKYKQLLTTGGPIYIYFFKPLIKGGVVGGANYHGSDMAFFGFFEASVAPDMLGHILIHESGHIIDRRQGRGALGMPLKTLNSSDGANCYDTDHPDGGLDFIKSYSYRGNDGGNGGPLAESFAEALANNVFCAPGKNCDYAHIYSSQNIVNYPTACLNTYNWIKQNVFGGGDFFATTTTASGDTSPNDNSCGGYYNTTFNENKSIDNFLHKDAPNFGDPQCTLPGSAAGRNAFYVELQRVLNGAVTKTKSGENIPDWILFKIIIDHESSYNPNDFSSRSSSGNGAYGLYQMNPQGAKGERQYDVGDVNWPMQIYNAAMLNTWGCKWRYWSSSAHFPEEIKGFLYNPRADCLPASTIKPVQ